MAYFILMLFLSSFDNLQKDAYEFIIYQKGVDNFEIEYR